MIRAVLVDDEPLATERLSRLLAESSRVEVAGTAGDTDAAESLIELARPDVVFLDIQMPGESGLELAARIPSQIALVFTTAYSEFALAAFERNAVDYLLKPVGPEPLARALNKVERTMRGTGPRPDMQALLASLRAALPSSDTPRFSARLPSRSGERVRFVDVSSVSHFIAKDKLTFAVVKDKEHAMEFTIAELELRLDPEKFVRVHRSTIVNLDFVEEMYTWFGGKLLLRLRDTGRTEVTVAKERSRLVRERLGIQ